MNALIRLPFTILGAIIDHLLPAADVQQAAVNRAYTGLSFKADQFKCRHCPISDGVSCGQSCEDALNHFEAENETIPGPVRKFGGYRQVLDSELAKPSRESLLRDYWRAQSFEVEQQALDDLDRYYPRDGGWRFAEDHELAPATFPVQDALALGTEDLLNDPEVLKSLHAIEIGCLQRRLDYAKGAYKVHTGRELIIPPLPPLPAT